MNNGFENIEAFARFNYLVDIARGNMPPTAWKFLPQEEKDIYLEEASIAEYVITEEDCNDFEKILVSKGRDIEFNSWFKGTTK